MNTTENIKQELAVREQRGEAPTIYDALDLHQAQLERKIPTGILTFQYARAALETELRNNPKLRECDPAKVLGAFAYGLQLGLVPGPLDLIHLVPFGSDVVFLVGYRGYVELAYRSGLVKDISATLVYQGDNFKVKGGTSPKIEHEIAARGEREIEAAYAVAHLKTGGTVFRVIYEEDWTRARKASQLGAKGKGPWADDFPAMVRKTAIRRLESLLPKSPESQVASAWDEQPAEPIEDGAAMLPESGGDDA